MFKKHYETPMAVATNFAADVICASGDVEVQWSWGTTKTDTYNFD